jgi:hypothetical protein
MMDSAYLCVHPCWRWDQIKLVSTQMSCHQSRRPNEHKQINPKPPLKTRSNRRFGRIAGTDCGWQEHVLDIPDTPCAWPVHATAQHHTVISTGLASQPVCQVGPLWEGDGQGGQDVQDGQDGGSPGGPHQ